MNKIEIIYSPSEHTTVHYTIPFSKWLTVNDAMHLSGLINKYPEVSNLDKGVFSKIVNSDYILNPKDRLEIYRNLLTRPMQRRRNKAK
ncbi:MAG: hypothetical protein A3E88_03050 [Legionellales bacterium RIFCSPHIGHO2_12_FULL_35_11]|nr:MAG: hypothetical protein A3E88_03050 [Legionellales bacterium RIFCSPHIGHO2_12_FULL_35_11]